MTETTSAAPTTEEWAPPPLRRVAVWPHTLGAFEHFDDAVAVMAPNGALLIWRWGYNASRGDVPIKGYAPGAWITYEHVGAGYGPNLFARQAREEAPLQPDPPQQEPDSDADEEPAPRSRADDPDPFVQLAPEALDAEAEREASRGHRRPRRGQLTQSGGDGEDEAFRRSSDALPLPEPEAGTAQPAARGGSALRGRGEGVARACRTLSARLFAALRPTRPLRLRRPDWSAYYRAWALLVLITAPAVLYVSLSS